MWIFTKFGFMSVVQTVDPSQLVVRSRARADLERVVTILGRSPVDILETPKRDYPYRAFVSRQEFANLLVAFAGTLDYDNFKSAVGKSLGLDVAHAHHVVWETVENKFTDERARRAQSLGLHARTYKKPAGKARVARAR